MGCDGLWWALMGSARFWCSLTVLDGLWQTLTGSESLLTAQAHTDSDTDLLWLSLTGSDYLWWAQTHSDLFWQDLTCLKLLWLSLTGSDGIWLTTSWSAAKPLSKQWQKLLPKLLNNWHPNPWKKLPQLAKTDWLWLALTGSNRLLLAMTCSKGLWLRLTSSDCLWQAVTGSD